MAQHDYNIANQSGADFRADLNNALSAIATVNSGASEPSTTFAHQLWVDTSNNVLKIRNAANSAFITTGVSITASNTFAGNLTGNATTATTLETARTINGTSFNGSANISFNTDSVSEGSSNLYFTAERVDDQVNTLLQAGTGIQLTYDDTAGTLTIANTNDADITGVVAGNGLTGGGTSGSVTLNVAVDDSSIEIDSDALRVKASGITNTMLAGSIANSKLANSSVTINSQSLALGGSLDLDTSEITENTNLYYTNERVDDRVSTLIQNGTGISWSYDDTAGTFTPTISLSPFNTSQLSESGNLYYTSARANTDFDTRLATKSTTNLAEGSSLYYTTARFDSAFTSKDTDDLSEGTNNLYYTQSRFDSAFGNKTTANLTENTNLYYTDTRANSAIDARVTKSFVDALGIQATSVADNSVVLGNDTTGNYIQTVTGTANKITVSGSGSESADITLSLPDDVQIASDLTVAGNLTVNGSLTSLDTTNLDIEDNLFQLNAGLTGSPVNDSGMLINRGTANNSIFMWDESADKFTLGLTTADGSATGNISLSSLGTLVANLEGAVTGTVSSLSNHDTADLTEGSNLYYTDARSRAAISATGDISYNSLTGVISFTQSASPVTSVNTLTGSVVLDTDDIGEGSTNVYFTNARADTRINLQTGANLDLSSKSTSSLSEGSNLYYTDARVEAVSINNVVEDTTPQLGGNLDLNSSDITGTGDINITGTITSSGNITGTLATAAQPNITSVGTLTGLTTTGNINFGDNDKAVFGAGSDLQIYHDGSNSWIKDEGTGVLAITTNGNGIGFYDSAGAEPMLFATKDNSVDLYFNGSKKLATTSTGIDVTGTVTADGVAITNDAANLSIQNAAADTGQKFRRNGNNDLIFERFASGSTSETMRLDASGKVGIGTTSPYTPLEVAAADSIIRLTVTGGVADKSRYEMRAIGASGYEGLQFRTANDANNSYNVLMHLDYDGNVGIGTTSVLSGNRLDVRGGNIMVGGFGGGTEYGLRLSPSDGSGYWNIANISGGHLTFNGSDTIGSNEKMRIDSSGNVGINTSNPSAKLHVEGVGDSQILIYETGTAPYTATLKLASQSTTSFGANVQYTSGAEQLTIENFGRTISSHAHGSIRFRTKVGNSSMQEVLHINGYTGNVGIGTNSPDAPLHVEATDASVVLSDSGRGQWWRIQNEESTDSLRIVSNDVNERMRINSSGNLIIGTTTGNPVNIGNHRLVVELNSSTAGIAVGADGLVDGRQVMTFYNDNGTVGTIITSGSSTSYNTSSDYRLKENVDYDFTALDRVAQLKPARFNFIADANKTVDGFLAHEVQGIVPEAISGEKDAMMDEEYEITPAVLDDDGNVVTEAEMGTREVPEYQGIDQSKLVPLLTKAIQEQQELINNLTARIEQLEN